MAVTLTSRAVPRLHPSQDVEWVLTDHHSIFTTCWADGCTRPPIWWLRHFGCDCGRSPVHRRHSVGGEHYCNVHSLDRGRGPVLVPAEEWSE